MQVKKHPSNIQFNASTARRTSTQTSTTLVSLAILKVDRIYWRLFQVMHPIKCCRRLICAIHILWPARNTSEEETPGSGMASRCSPWAAERKLRLSVRQSRTRRSCRIAWVAEGLQDWRNRRVKGPLLLISEALALLSRVGEPIFSTQKIRMPIFT